MSRLALRLWPLVGRKEELEFAAAALESAGGIVVVGDAGVGKSRLVAEIAEVVAGWGWTTERMQGSEALAAVPLGAFAHLLPEGWRGDDPTEPVGADHISRAYRALATRSGDRELLFVVDDAHWLDHASASLLCPLLQHGVSLVLTVRRGEPMSDAVVMLWKDGLLERLDLQPLSVEETVQLAEAALGGALDAVAARRLYDVTLGNPLFAREILHAALASGALQPLGDGWTWVLEFVPGPRLGELVEGRLASLGPFARQVVEVVAVGEPLSPQLLAAVLGRSEAEVVATLAELERSGMVAVSRADRRVEVRSAHPVHGEVLRAEVGVLAHQRICSALADGVVERGRRRRTDLVRCANWMLVAGDRSDPGLLGEAAGAVLHIDPALAEKLARASLEGRPSIEASVALGRALAGSRRYGDAEAVLRPVLDEVDADGDRVLVALALVQAGAFGDGRWEEGERVLAEALAEITDESWRGVVQAQRVSLFTLAGRTAEARSLGAPLAKSPDERVRLRAISATGVAMSLGGCTDWTLAHTETGLELALRHAQELPDAVHWMITTRLYALIIGGHFAEADDLLDFIDAAADQGTSAGYRSLARGRVALARGALTVAEQHLSEAVGTLAANDQPPGLLPWAEALLAEARALRGVGATTVPTTRPQVQRYEADRRRAWARVRAATGTVTQAVADLRDLARWCRADGQHAMEALALHEALRMGLVRGTVPRLIELGDRVDGRIAPEFAAHAVAARTRDGPALLEASDRLVEIDLRPAAADAAAQAAAAFDREGRRAPAAEARVRARRLAAECDGLVTALLGALGSPAGLTTRETEVARLAASGLTNREIASRLYVSVRTVEGHLAQAYAKLGIRRRRDLRAALEVENR